MSPKTPKNRPKITHIDKAWCPLANNETAATPTKQIEAAALNITALTE